MSSYTTDIPISGDTLGSTRDRIRTNFQQNAIVEAINHVAFNEIGQGKHKFLQMPIQVTAPTTLANEGGFYIKLGASPAEPNLWFRGQNNGFEYQLTRVNQAQNALFGTFTNYLVGPPSLFGGWTFLPGGLIFQYGTTTSTGSTNTIDFPIAFTTTDAIVTITRASNTGSAAGVDTITPTSFRFLRGGSNNVQFYWHAVGK